MIGAQTESFFGGGCIEKIETTFWTGHGCTKTKILGMLMITKELTKDSPDGQQYIGM